jgi:hypothetical protein
MSLILSTKETVEASGSGSFPGVYLSHSIAPLPAPFVVAAGGSSITVTYIIDRLIFPLEYIDYLDLGGTVVRITGVDAWDQVPSATQAPHIITMQEASGDVVDYILTVFSREEISSEDEEVTEPTIIDHVTTFQIEIFADYDESKVRLEDAVNARR